MPLGTRPAAPPHFPTGATRHSIVGGRLLFCISEAQENQVQVHELLPFLARVAKQWLGGRNGSRICQIRTAMQIPVQKGFKLGTVHRLKQLSAAKQQLEIYLHSGRSTLNLSHPFQRTVPRYRRQMGPQGSHAPVCRMLSKGSQTKRCNPFPTLASKGNCRTCQHGSYQLPILSRNHHTNDHKQSFVATHAAHA